jgi:hypothetical protein
VAAGYPLNDDGLDEAALEDDDDLRHDAAGLFGVDVGDASVQQNVIDVDAEVGDGGGGAVTVTRTGSTSTHDTVSCGKRKSGVWLTLRRLRMVMLELLLSARYVG